MTKNANEVFLRTYSVLVENEPGVLARIAGLFSSRGFNIESLAVGETLDPTVSRMTIVAEGTPAVLEQVNKQLNKLIPVISVLTIQDKEMITQELMLAKLKADPGIKPLVGRWLSEGKCVGVVEECDPYVILRIVATRAEEPQILEGLKGFEIVEICRTGEVALSRTRTFGYLEKERKGSV